MRFSLKTSKQMYSLETERTARSIIVDIQSRVWQGTLFSLVVPQLLVPCYKVVLVEIELMIGIFLVFEVIDSQGNYMEELYDPSEYKLT